MLCKAGKGSICDLEAFCFGTEADDGFDFLRVVWVGWDDKETSKKVRGNTVGSNYVVGAADDGVTTVGS